MGDGPSPDSFGPPRAEPATFWRGVVVGIALPNAGDGGPGSVLITSGGHILKLAYYSSITYAYCQDNSSVPWVTPTLAINSAINSKGSADLLFKVRGYRLLTFTSCSQTATRLDSLHVAIAPPVSYDRYFFVTVALLKSRRRLQDPDFDRLAFALARMRRKHGFLLTAWVFLPDHWHAIIYPPYPLTISRVFQAVKVSSVTAINVRLGEAGELWQGRFFDRALRTVQEYHKKVEYIHWNPVRRGLVKRPEEWKWSSAVEYAGVDGGEQERRLPADENTRI